MYVGNIIALFVDGSLFVGIITLQLLTKLEQDGDISSTDAKRFYKGVQAFYLSAVDYAIDNLPLNDTLLKNAEFVYVPKREQATLSQVVYFVTRLVLYKRLNHMACMHACDI